MNDVMHFKRDRLAFEPYAGPPGKSEIARLVGTPVSETMGAGIAVFEDAGVKWTVKYDELICVLSGRFRLVVGEKTFECAPGDVLWIPNGTPLEYASDGRAEVFYALYPVDWKERG